MAGISMKDIKIRIKSMESTKQITKAMEMVASSKLRHAQDRVIRSRPYFETLYQAFQEIIASNRDLSSPYLVQREVKKVCYIVIAGDRGLAGGYNSNILRMTYEDMMSHKAEVTVLPIGKKAGEFFHTRGIPFVTDMYLEAADVSIGDCFSMAKMLAKGFLDGSYDAVYIGFTNFVSILSQTPATLSLLPLIDGTGKKEPQSVEQLLTYDPDCESVFNAIVPEYLGGLVYGSLCESVASELAARRTAMDAATKNAEDMIDSLSLKFNRARQGAITQEITEIVAGSQN